MKAIEEEEVEAEDGGIPLVENDRVGVLDVNVSADRELLDFDWALGYGTAPYVVGNVVIQLSDIVFHAVLAEVFPLHIVANCVIMLWAGNFLYNYIEISRWRTVGFSVILIYSVLMISFFATAGFNDSRGQVRAMALAFFAFTIFASVVSQLSLRKIRPDDPPEWRDVLIL